MPSEVVVKVQENDTSMSKEFLEYRPFMTTFEDPIMMDMIEQTMAEFKERPKEPSVKVRIKVLDGE